MNFIQEASKGLLSHHSAGGRKILEDAEEEKLGKPKEKMAKKDLIHIWTRFQPRKQKICRISSRDLKKRKDTIY